MPRIPNEDVEPVVAQEANRRHLARAPVIDGRVVGATQVLATDMLRDDRGQRLVGEVHGNGTVTLAEPTNRRVFFTGWVV